MKRFNKKATLSEAPGKGVCEATNIKASPNIEYIFKK